MAEAAAAGSGSITFTKGFAFVRKDDRNLYLADESALETSAALTTTGGVSSPNLSRDGKRVVFVQKVGTDTQLAVVPTTGGVASLVLASTAQVKNLRTPVFSPDGARIAFAYDEGTSSSIGLVNADGSGFVKVAGGTSLAYASPTFFPDGLSVLVMSGGAGLAYTQLEQVTLATGAPANVTNTLGNEAQSIANRVVLSPDGKTAVFDARVSSGSTRLFTINLDTKVVTKLNDYVAEPGANDSFPTWQDGATVVFSSDSGGNDNVYRIGANGTGRTLALARAIEPSYGP